MRHKRIPSSKRHKKIKNVHSIESEDEDGDKIVTSQKPKKEPQISLKQQMPRKMQELLQMKDAAKNRKKHVKPKQKTNQPGLLCITTNIDGDDEGHTRGLKFVPSVIQQGPYESEFQFMQRLNKMASKAKAEAQVEEKFDVDFCPPVERTRPKILSTKTGKEVKYTSKGKVHLEDAETKRTRKAEKRRERAAKLKAKKRKKTSREDREDTWIDQFDFNDVVDEPPAFSKGRRAKLLKM